MKSFPKAPHLYNVEKASEGGFGQRAALQVLKERGIEAKPATSVYRGMTAVVVYSGDRRILDRVSRLLYGF
jgi:hypothetical protein